MKRNEKLKMIKEFEEQITTDTSNQEGEEDEEDELEAYMAEINNKVKNEQVKKAKSLLEETRKVLYLILKS